MKTDLKIYSDLLNEIKIRVRQGQLRANLSANAEMLAAYWDIGRMIQKRQAFEGWGKGVIPRLAVDLKNEFSEMKGFSERNLKCMVQFYKEYTATSIGQPPVAKLPQPSNSIVKLAVSQLESSDNQLNILLMTPWSHHIILIQKIKDLPTRYWYMQQIIINGWSKEVLIDMIKSNLHTRQGNATSYRPTDHWIDSVSGKR